jgi:hypothetical protein
LYIFCGDHPLCAVLRPSDIDASAGSLTHVQRIVQRIRQVWPDVPIMLRGDSGFCRDYLFMRWCEQNGVDFLFGLAKNQRLLRIVGQELQQVKEAFAQTPPGATRVFIHSRISSTARTRVGAGRVGWWPRRNIWPRGPTRALSSLPSLSVEAFAAATLYEKEYCGRGEMENRIKEQQLMLFADRTSCETMRANQLRLYFSTVAYVLLLRALREHGLKETALAQAQGDTIRVRLLKIGAVVRVTVRRRVALALSEAFPLREVFTRAWQNLRQLHAARPLGRPTG